MQRKQKWGKPLLKEEIDDLVARVGVFEWGSCQYQTAAGFFYLIREMREDGIPWEQCLSLLGIECNFSKIENNFKNFGGEEIAGGFDKKEYEALFKMPYPPPDPPSAEAAFEMTKDRAWDLWGAAPTIAEWCFKDLKIEAPQSPGFGPSGNVLVQNTNYIVGLCCALLYEYGLVKDIECFKDYDT